MSTDNFYSNLSLIFSQVRFADLVDLILVWAVVYRILILTKRSGAVQILSGIGFLAIGYFISIWGELIAFNWILEKFFSNLFLIVVILFQAEIRKALAQFGSNPFLFGSSNIEARQTIEELCQGAIMLSQRRLGALLVIEKEIVLDYFIESGVELDAEVSSELLVSLFSSQSPLHDGAVIVRSGRAHMAGCFLPLSKNPILDKNLGTRHRAAIGLSEETDAVVIVVSEENGNISLVFGGNLFPGLDHNNLRQTLYRKLGLNSKLNKEAASAGVEG